MARRLCSRPPPTPNESCPPEEPDDPTETPEKTPAAKAKAKSKPKAKAREYTEEESAGGAGLNLPGL